VEAIFFLCAAGCNNVETGGKAMVDLAQWALANWP